MESNLVATILVYLIGVLFGVLGTLAVINVLDYLG